MKRLMIIALASLGLVGQMQAASFFAPKAPAANFITEGRINRESLEGAKIMVSDLKNALTTTGDNFRQVAEGLQNVKVIADVGPNASEVLKEAGNLVQTMQRGGVPPINATVGIDQLTADSLKSLVKEGVPVRITMDPQLMRLAVGAGVAGTGVLAGCKFGKDLAACTFDSKNSNWKRGFAGVGLISIAATIIGGGWLSWKAVA